MEADIQHLDELVDICEHKLKAILDNHAPMKEISITIRHTVPWFTTEIITQKRKVQRREKIWCKYGQDHQKQALKIEHSKYKSILKATMEATLCEKIKECGRDSKILYKFVSNITGTTKINPMPNANSDEQLANEFAEFFIATINKIREDLDSHEKYIPYSQTAVPPLRDIEPLQETEVIKIVKSIATNNTPEK